MADDLKAMREKGIVNEETIFVITASHTSGFTKVDKDTSEILIYYLKNYNFKNKIIINDKYISNPEIAENIDKLVNIKNCKRILRIAKSFVARRWFITDDARQQVIKEFVNISRLYLEENYFLK